MTKNCCLWFCTPLLIKIQLLRHTPKILMLLLLGPPPVTISIFGSSSDSYSLHICDLSLFRGQWLLTFQMAPTRLGEALISLFISLELVESISSDEMAPPSSNLGEISLIISLSRSTFCLKIAVLKGGNVILILKISDWFFFFVCINDGVFDITVIFNVYLNQPFFWLSSQNLSSSTVGILFLFFPPSSFASALFYDGKAINVAVITQVKQPTVFRRAELALPKVQQPLFQSSKNFAFNLTPPS